MAAQWTFMVYMAGFNNLTSFATKDLEEMRRVGSTADVQVAVFIKRLGHSGAQYILLGEHGQADLVEQVGNADSGRPQTLLDFVRWAHANAPAERYALTVWNHGSGWRPDDLDDLYDEVRASRGDTGVTPREMGLRSSQQVALSLFSSTVQEILALPDAGDRGIASDDGTGHSLDTIELGRVLKAACEDLGGPLALLGMDACLMSAFEVAYEAREVVEYVVGSEELEPGDGWPYTAILTDLNAQPGASGAELGGIVVSRYIESYENRRDQWPVTQAAVNTAHLEDFAVAVDGLATALNDHLADGPGAALVTSALGQTVYFTGELVDLRTFCLGLAASIDDDSVRQGARAVLDALQPGAYVVAEGHRGPTVEECGGITLYCPKPLQSVSKYYADLSFAGRQWDDFLRRYQSALTGN
ncbi:clostripain-related cysteine peptidase [Agromyces sp. NPDC004153]